MFFKKFITPPRNQSQQINAQPAAAQSPSYQYYFERLENNSRRIGGCRCGLMVFGQLEKDRSKFFELNSCKIDAHINDLYSTTIIQQSFRNISKTPVEVEFRIPLPPKTSVTNFKVTFQDKKLQGEIKSKQDAFNTYSDAISEGHQSFLAEIDSDGYFVVSFGNIPPPSTSSKDDSSNSSNSNIIIELTTQSEIGTHLSNLHYYLHKCFFPSSQMSSDFKLSMDIDIDLSSPIQEITCTPFKYTHKINNNKATVKVDNVNNVQSTFILSITPTIDTSPLYHMEYNPTTKSTALGLTFYPQFNNISPDDVTSRGEYIFLVDCSGSMAGFTMDKAKQTLQILMRSLPIDSYFNIYCFGSGFKSMSPVSMVYDDTNLANASNYINTIFANMGGTELLPPLISIYNNPINPKYPRQIFIITDGEIPNRDKVVDFVLLKRNVSRIFTVGLGDMVDKYLVTGLSNACGGYYELVTNNQTMESQVLRLMSKSVEPALTNIRIDWGDLLNDSKMQIQPQTPPFIIRTAYNNERLIIYYLIENMDIDINADARPQHTIRFICDDPTGKEVSFIINLDWRFAKINNNKDGINFNSLVASNVISILQQQEQQGGYSHGAVGSQPMVNNKDKILDLSLRYGVVSKYASYVVVSESDKPTVDTMQKIKIGEGSNIRGNPPPPPSYNGGVLRRTSSMSPSSRSSVSNQLPRSAPKCYRSGGGDRGGIPPPPSTSGSFPELTKTNTRNSASTTTSSHKAISKPAFTTTTASTTTPPKKIIISSKFQPSDDLLFRLMSSQKAMGNWTDQLVEFDSVMQQSFMSSCSKIITDEQIIKQIPSDVFTTLFVIVIMNKYYQSKHDQYELIVSKAIKYCKSKLSPFSIQFDLLYQQCLQ